MARPGRKRKAGARYPSGKLKPSDPLKPQVEPISGAAWQRIVQFGKQLGADERLATELGRLNRFGELTLSQTVVGFRIAEIYGRYEGLKGLRRSVRSPSYNAAFGESGVAEELMDPDALKELERRVRAATTAFQGLVGYEKRAYDERGKECWVAVPGEIPRQMLSIVEQLCVEDRAIPAGCYPEVRRLFDRLAMSWQITVPKRGRGAQPAGTRPTATQDPPPADKPAPARVNIDKVTWLRVMHAMRPDLSNEQLENNYDFAIAVKQREVFRRSKRDPKYKNVVRLPSVDKGSD